jgi:hypothetical protein
MPRFLAAVWALAGLPAAWEGSHTIQPVERSPMAVAFRQQQRAHPAPKLADLSGSRQPVLKVGPSRQ